MIKRLPTRRISGYLSAALLLIAGGTAMGADLARPRIFVTPADLPRLKAMTEDDSTNALGVVPAAAWSDIVGRADQFLQAKPYTRRVHIPLQKGGKGELWEYTLSKTPPPPHNDNPNYPVWTSMFQERGDSITTRIRYFMTAYLVTGEVPYFQAAKEMVMAIAAWPGIWTDPQYGGGRPCLDTGHAAVWVAIFYDWGYEALTDDERDMLRTALAEKALAPIAEYVPNLPVYHNYNTVVSCGLGIGALALLGEDDRAEQWIDLAISQMRKYMDAQGEDGGPMEGPMYGTYAGSTLSDLIWALQTTDYDNDLLEHPFLANLPRYCIVMANPSDYHLPTFGDGGFTQAYQRTNRVLALSGNTDAAWYLSKINGFAADTPRGFLALDPQRVTPQTPTFNPSDCFVDVGYAALRDGFKANAAYLAFKAGPPSDIIHHNHFDHNSFQINYGGNWLIGDPGYRNYYDPAPRKYTVSTFGHNSIIVDLDQDYLETLKEMVPGHDQVRKAGPRIAQFFTSDTFDYVAGSAAVAYNPEAGENVLNQFRRRIVFVKPNLFFICDTLESPAAHTYSFLLHTQRTGDINIQNENLLRVINGRSILDAAIFSDAGPLTMVTGAFSGAEQYGPYLAATTAQPATSARFVAAMTTDVTDQILTNPGFENGMNGWIHRTAENTAPNHTIDTDIKHSGQASARVTENGYYYSPRFVAPPGAVVRARFWARASAPGASCRIYFWKNNKAFASVVGPQPEGEEWQKYAFEATVPAGTQEVCLALNYGGPGSVWYDDVDIEIEAPEKRDPDAIVPGKPPVFSVIGNGEGIVCTKDGRTCVLLQGEAGNMRRISAAGHTIHTDAQLAVIILDAEKPAAFVVDGSSVKLDDRDVPSASGRWRVE